jgi:acetyl esterase/lipase
VPSQVTFNIVRVIILSAIRRLPLHFYLNAAVKRALLLRLQPRHLQLLQPTFSQTYKTYVESKRSRATKKHDVFALAHLRYDIQSLPYDASLGWLGDRAAAKKVVLFLHGGGYINPIQPSHFEWCYQAYVVGGADRGKEVAVAMLQYTLAPNAIFPCQLRQAAAAVRHIIETCGIAPGDLVIGGDSAGGNLTAQVLGHVLHPRPGIQPLLLDSPLGGAFLVSPWLSTKTNTRSYKDNANIDMLTPSMMRDVAKRAFRGPEFEEDIKANRGWSMPMEVDPAWFFGLEKAVRSVYVTVGEQELFRDHVMQFVESVRMRNEGLRLKLEVPEKEAHDFILIEAEFGQIGDATRRMRDWFGSLLF